MLKLSHAAPLPTSKPSSFLGPAFEMSLNYVLPLRLLIVTFEGSGFKIFSDIIGIMRGQFSKPLLKLTNVQSSGLLSSP